MSDGGPERASLGVEVWKSYQKWGAQRSAVRSIAWLGVRVVWREGFRKRIERQKHVMWIEIEGESKSCTLNVEERHDAVVLTPGASAERRPQEPSLRR